MKSILYTLLFVLLTAPAYGQTYDTTAQKSMQQKKQNMDRFIDADGDGICDKRAQGLGFGRQKKMHGMKQQGNDMQQNKRKAQQGGNKK